MLHTTAGQLAIESALPEDMRGKSRTLDKKGVADLFKELALKHPQEYPEIARQLGHVARHTSYLTGGNSFGINHLQVSPTTHKTQLALKAATQKIRLDPGLSDAEKNNKVTQLLLDASPGLTDSIYNESLASGNPLAKQIQSGSRGSPTNLKSLIGGDLLYVDHKDRPLPIPILRSYSQGLSPAEYYAGSFGARKGVVDAKQAVADAGYLSKVLKQAAHRLVTVGDDNKEHNPNIGLPVQTADPHNAGALLARTEGGYPANTTLTPKILSDLRTKGVDKLLVRSPLTSSSPDGGVYAKDVGVREYGRLPLVGEHVGQTAADTIGEPLTQSQLSSKHGGGVAGQSKGVSGFKAIENLVQIPSSEHYWATHAQKDGRVQMVEKAPQGGHYVMVDGEQHHISQGYDPIVKKGEDVEAGDVLSDGTPNPAEVVHHKGLGEGRRYMVEALSKAYKGAGISTHRRNLELAARGLVNHVRMTDEMGDHLPEDVVPYHRVEASYTPRPGHRKVEPKKALGHYLEAPVLHYTIGTQVKPSVVKMLEDYKVPEVTVHHEPAPFHPEMVRGLESLTKDEDWQSRFMGSSLSKNLLHGAHRGDSSDENSTSFVPALARGVNFGRTGIMKSLTPPSA
jgi:hypothetical protein